MKISNFLPAAALAALVSMAPLSAQAATGDFTTGKGTFLLNGKPFVVKAAEVHYPRIPRAYWDQRIKMCKALGMNTLCIYVFWNIHEPQEGKFDFTGNNDVAAFCRLAQKNGMYVIVRPGPYACAEWEMGALPWWLLKKKDIRLRELDPYFMDRVARFEEQVARQLEPLTIQHGGPIIMVQVENEYGSYGENKPYIAAIRDVLKKNWYSQGKDGKMHGPVLFQCDWSSNFTKNGLDDLIWTMNFGTGANIDEQFKRLGELRPDAPKMCSEFWSGWFDKWGARHETRSAKQMVEGIDEMLSKGISFSLYMTHGGTSFGHWAGANSPGFAPDVTSYDYDAPINEYGQATPKYYELRNMLAKYAGGKKLPAVPAPAAPLVSVPEFSLKGFVPMAAGADSTAESKQPLTFEDMNMGWGSMIYTTTLPATTGGTLNIDGAHDYAQVFINNRYVGKIDRVKNERSVALPATRKGDKLSILVEGMGRINFGRAIKDFKGITGNVTITSELDGDDVTWKLNNWTISRISDSYATAKAAISKGAAVTADAGIGNKAGYYYGTFNVKKVGDTFLNMERWGKGQVYVNGHALGRFWRIGPQQTLYVPGCWLKKGSNEIIVLDVVAPQENKLWCQDKPQLDKLQLEKTNLHNNIGDKPDLNSIQPVYTGNTASGNGWQTLKFGKTATGRYLAIEVSANHNAGEPTAIAELYADDASGKRLSREPWTAKYADSESEQGNHTLDKVFDLQESTYWQTVPGTALPHLIVIDLGSKQTISAIEYLPRAEQGAPGSAKALKVYVY